MRNVEKKSSVCMRIALPAKESSYKSNTNKQYMVTGADYLYTALPAK